MRGGVIMYKQIIAITGFLTFKIEIKGEDNNTQVYVDRKLKFTGTKPEADEFVNDMIENMRKNSEEFGHTLKIIE